MMTDSKELNILGACTDIRSLMMENIHLFNFSKIGIREKAYLLMVDYKTYSPILNPQTFTIRDRVHLVTQWPRLGSKITFTDGEFKRMSACDYSSLLTHNFKKYINVVYFEKLSEFRKKDVFITHPEWFYKNTNYFPQFSLSVLYGLLESHEDFLLKVFPDIVLNKTDAWIWQRLCETSGSALYPLLIKNISTLSTKTDTRRILRYRPELIKLLTFEDMQRSNLNAREWVLLINSLINGYPEVFKDWSLPDNIKQELSLDVSVILISGQNKSSKRLINSIKKTISKTEEEIESAAVE